MSDNSTTNDDAQSTDDTKQCHRCEERTADVIPETSSPPLCQQCVKDIMRESARAGERGQGQRSTGKQRAIGRARRRGPRG
jgi:hypothetical protein